MASYYDWNALSPPAPMGGGLGGQPIAEFAGQLDSAPSPLAPQGAAADPMSPGAIAGIGALASLGTSIANDFRRREQNKAQEEYKARVRKEAEASRVSQEDDARLALDRNRVKSRVAAAQVNQQALMRRGAAMVKAGYSGVGGTTAEQIIQSEELRQSRALAGIEVQLRMNTTDQATRNRAIHAQERQRLLALTSMTPQQSTLGADLINTGTQYVSTYMQIQGAQQMGVQRAVEATT